MGSMTNMVIMFQYLYLLCSKNSLLMIFQNSEQPLACLLLSLESVYPAAAQLATDMLTRLRNSGEEICEILLSKGKILSAIHFADERGLIQR